MTDNEADGADCYLRGDKTTRDWFHRQWEMWPRRADERLTTNGSFHYGALTTYRQYNEGDPPMSAEFKMHVQIMDGFRSKER